MVTTLIGGGDESTKRVVQRRLSSSVAKRRASPVGVGVAGGVLRRRRADVRARGIDAFQPAHQAHRHRRGRGGAVVG